MLLLASCGAANDGAIDIALIGDEDAVFADSLRLSPGAQHIRAATQSGLVAMNRRGEVVPSLAESWVPTEDGLSLFFRLRDIDRPDGRELTAQAVRSDLLATIGQLEGTSLGQDLSVIEDVRAMTERVLEIRLSSPEPYLLQLLAQPELAIRQPGDGTGPLLIERTEDGARLQFKPPLERGEPEDENWQEDVREIDVRVAGPQEAIAMFNAGEVQLVLGGDLGSLPLVETGPLSSGTLRIDAAVGLFGLLIRNDEGMLGNSDVREGLAMALDREGLLADFNVDGLTPTTRPVSPGLPGDPGFVAERWQDMALEDRQSEAVARVQAWRQQFDEGDLSQPYTISIAMGRYNGWELLFDNLVRQFAGIDIELVRAESRAAADLVLIDRIARYPAPRWFLNQFNCSVLRTLCSETADALVADATAQTDPTQRATLMAQAEAELTLENIYIPIGSPLRWTLVRGSVDGLESNAYAFHPLPPLARVPR